jgi:hypothetical protein
MKCEKLKQLTINKLVMKKFEKSMFLTGIEESRAGDSSDVADKWSSSEAKGQPDLEEEVKVDRERKDKEDDRKTLPSRPIYVKERSQSRKGHSMTIEQELQESFIRAVQHGQDDNEWNQFYLAEKQRLVKGNKWAKWKRQLDESMQDETEESLMTMHQIYPRIYDRTVALEDARIRLCPTSTLNQSCDYPEITLTINLRPKLHISVLF